MKMRTVLAAAIITALALGQVSNGHAASTGETKAFLNQASAEMENGNFFSAYEKAAKAMNQIWKRMGLRTGKVLLVERKAEGYGVYNQRPDNVYRIKGDMLPTIFMYVELLGYHFKSVDEGVNLLGISADLAVLDPKGNLLFGKDSFMHQEFKSHALNKEFFLNITVNFTRIPPGDYVIKLTIHDKNGGGQTSVKVPIKIRK